MEQSKTVTYGIDLGDEFSMTDERIGTGTSFLAPDYTGGRRWPVAAASH